MIINTSAFTMHASTMHTQSHIISTNTKVSAPMTAVDSANLTKGNTFGDLFQLKASKGDPAEKYENGQSLPSDLYHSFSTATNHASHLQRLTKDYHEQLLEQLALFMKHLQEQLMALSSGIDSQGFFDYSVGDTSFQPNETLNVASSNTNFNLWSRTTTSTYVETEQISFQTQGCAITEDGRELTFQLDLSMSREFVTQSAITEATNVILTDPLVIQLDSNPPGISDQQWQFDIDSDGQPDTMSLLQKGSGFLAVDWNEDGVIGNGHELFGAVTGNGFKELAEFDEDHNGWIDERDAIYQRLKVWVKDDSGADKLLSLKDANVGAINLSSLDTDFHHTTADNTTKAYLRKSGFYLREDGTAALLQQVDFAKEA